MSEINSIANGTFTIGSTSAINFQAGPGISISEPSEGTVRIGADETVLWEGQVSGAGIEIPLSESFRNFKALKFVTTQNYTSLNTILNVQDSNVFGIPFGHIQSDGMYNEFISLSFTDNTHGSLTNAKSIEWPLTSTTTAPANVRNDWTWTFRALSKIIGINRISGSNE